MLIYHITGGLLESWRAKTKSADEAAHFLIRSIRSLLTYGTALVTAVIVLNLLGLLHPLQQVMSFPILHIGTHAVTMWIIIKAALIFVAFIYAFRLLQAYLDYKIYPSIGVDEGLGYALNTFLKYAVLVIGFLVSLKIVGIDLRFLLVFAGAVGIGIGFGLQNMAANFVSGFSLIFGGKIRKGDWIEVGDTLGVVTDIYLGATKVRTRDNIEYLIPNSNLISDVIINYSLSSPYIRIDLAVGVSYDADPKVVEEILVDVAAQEPLVNQHRAPEVRFVEYGDSSINFELIFWIDVRTTARRKVRSQLYFAIFNVLKQAGIEIPFPQRDVHLVQGAESP
jgi:small-conductance mechanosensitive channel